MKNENEYKKMLDNILSQARKDEKSKLIISFLEVAYSSKKDIKKVVEDYNYLSKQL